MTNPLDAQVTAVKDRLTAAARQRARAEHAHDAAVEAERAVRAELADEFGVTEVEDARSTLAELEGQVSDLVAEITAELDQLSV